MREILIILACVPLFAVNSFCDKFASSNGTFSDHIKYNIWKFGIGSVALLPMFLLDELPRFEFGALACGVLCGLMYAVNKTAVLKGYQLASVSFMTLCHAAGMLLPCIVGHFFWNEKLTVLSLIGVLITIASIVVLKGTEKNASSVNLKGILIGLAVFLSSGGVMILQKIMGISFAWQSVTAYNFYSFVTPMVIMLVMMLFTPKQRKNEPKTCRKNLLYAGGSAVSLCVISMVMTSISGAVSSVILFPLFNGTGIVIVCIASIFAFKEKLNWKQWIAVFMALGGMCLTVI